MRNLSTIVNGVRTTVSKHSPEILTGIGIAGMITTTVLAIKATPKALQLMEEKKEDLKSDNLKPVEVVQTCWKPYVPAVVTGILSISCIVGASTVNYKRNAAIATAYKLSEAALDKYKEKVVETIGEKKEKVIREKIYQDEIKEKVKPNTQVIVTDNGDTLFLDGISGRVFKSSIDIVKAAINKINRTMTYDNYVSLSDFYDEIGLSHTDVSDYLGWNLDDGLVEMSFEYGGTDDGKPCIILVYNWAPRYDFSKLM